VSNDTMEPKMWLRAIRAAGRIFATLLKVGLATLAGPEKGNAPLLPPDTPTRQRNDYRP
jgi:hypothetical protein